jgi:hypothetical protein
MVRGRLSILVVFLLLIFCRAASAQFVYGQSDRTFDRARLAGLWWVGTLEGRINPGDLEALPSSIDIGDLGITDKERGWMWEADVGLARRHRLRVSGSDRTSDGMTTIAGSVEIGPIQVPVQVPVTSTLGITEFETNYNFLFVANSAVDAGFLVGVGHFEATVAASAPVGGVDQTFETSYPSLGGNALFNPGGRFRAYVEVSGFPEVTVDDLTGWKMSFTARAEMFITQHVGAYVGYRTYEIDLKEEDLDVDVNLRWNGLIIGGAVRY